MTINITVANKVATAIDAPAIICGNSDYVINFTFDSEWDSYTCKTARFVFNRDGAKKYIDVLFEGTNCEVPILTNINSVEVGVYAGELSTTTGAKLSCQKSILCGSETPETQGTIIDTEVMQYMDEKARSAETSAQEAQEIATNLEEVTQRAEQAADEVDDLVDNAYIPAIKEQKAGAKLTFWVGTKEEYDNLVTKDNNCLYLFTDDPTLNEIAQNISILTTELENLSAKVNAPKSTVLFEGVANFGAQYVLSDDIGNYDLFHVYYTSTRHTASSQSTTGQLMVIAQANSCTTEENLSQGQITGINVFPYCGDSELASYGFRCFVYENIILDVSVARNETSSNNGGSSNNNSNVEGQFKSVFVNYSWAAPSSNAVVDEVNRELYAYPKITKIVGFKLRGE